MGRTKSISDFDHFKVTSTIDDCEEPLSDKKIKTVQDLVKEIARIIYRTDASEIKIRINF